MKKSCMLLALLCMPILSTTEHDAHDQRFLSTIYSFLISPQEAFKSKIKEQYPTTPPQGPIVVQKNTTLDQQEILFGKQRELFVAQTLRKHFNINKPLKITFCCGGGGNRAMIALTGLLQGAAESKVLDATTYLLGVSGSTWALLPLAGLWAENIPHDQAFKKLLQTMAQNLSDNTMLCINGTCAPDITSLEANEEIIKQIIIRYAYNQPLTIVNLFGPLVAEYSLSALKNSYDVTWSSLQPAMLSGQYPLPICCSIFEQGAKNFKWFEMSPFQAGNKEIGYIPVAYLGSEFTNGKLQINQLKPEYSLSFYVGVYGSGFAASVQEMINFYHEQKTYRFFQRSNTNMTRMPWHAAQIINGIINNILNTRNPYACGQFPAYHLSPTETLGLFDAGIDCNIPLPMIADRTERQHDLIFVFDSHPGESTAVQKAFAYCAKHGYQLPTELATLSKQQLSAQDMLILNDPRNKKTYNSKIPTIIYIPTRVDVSKAPYTTLNFKYTPQEIEQLSSSMRFVFTSNIKTITQVMQQVAQQRYNKN